MFNVDYRTKAGTLKHCCVASNFYAKRSSCKCRKYRHAQLKFFELGPKFFTHDLQKIYATHTKNPWPSLFFFFFLGWDTTDKSNRSIFLTGTIIPRLGKEKKKSSITRICRRLLYSALPHVEISRPNWKSLGPRNGIGKFPTSDSTKRGVGGEVLMI